MNRQSTVIFGAVLFAFIVFITVRGDLPAWLSLFSKQGTHSSYTVNSVGPAQPQPKKGGGLLGSIMTGLKLGTDVLSGNWAGAAVDGVTLAGSL